MKKTAISFVLALAVLSLVWPGGALSDPMEELLSRFRADYFASEPPDPHSSIKTDYRITQAALGGFYTTQSLSLLYEQNRELLAKYDEMLAKYDQVLRQNKEIVRLLGVLAKKTSQDKNAQYSPSAEKNAFGGS